MTTAPATAADDAPARYCLYPGDTAEEQARAAFLKRFGVEPEKVFQMYGAGREWWAGPVPQKEGEK